MLQEVTWDEALADTEGFTKVKDELGPEGFAVFSCSKSTNEMVYGTEVRPLALGTNNIDSCNRT